MTTTDPAPVCGDVFSCCVCGQPAGHAPADPVHACDCGGSWRHGEGCPEIVSYPGGLDEAAAQARAAQIRAAAIAACDIDLIAATMPLSARGGIRFPTPPAAHTEQESTMTQQSDITAAAEPAGGPALPRTVDEIKARIAEVQPADFFGAQAEELVRALPFAEAAPWLRASTAEAEWAPTLTPEQVRAAAVAYLEFAMGKADNHRGLSASRSVDHFRGWLWLLGLDEQVDWEDYAQYGAPILRKAAELLNATEVWTRLATPALERMAQGLPCDPDGCGEGCGVA